MLITALACLLGTATAQDTPREYTAIDAQLVLKVKRPQEIADELVTAARAQGGYFSSRTAQQVSLKIPTASAEAFIEEVGERGLLVSRSFTNTGLTAQISDARARLKAREAVLARYFEVLEGASAESVVTVERAIVGLISEIEGLKGQLRSMEHEATFADITVDFQFRDRAAPVRDGSSSFEWLNTMNLSDLMRDFHQGYSPHGSRRYTGDVAPDGFAPYRIRREARAVSPDDVVIRVRAERHRPEADLAFWEEALQERMAAAGYRQVGEPEALTVDGVAGSLVELSAPMGVDDYTYLVAIFPHGRKLIIAEAAGEIATFEEREEAVRAAIAGLSL
ncbi:MAG: hypothetical protein ACI8S6_002195 [Myxococcota bacterium]|jgi:hypothetical protein